MKKETDWNLVGRLIARLNLLFGLVRETLQKLEADLQIQQFVEWCLDDGRQQFVESLVVLGQSFVASRTKAAPDALLPIKEVKEIAKRKLAVWKSIEVGGKSLTRLIAKAATIGEVSKWARDIMSKPAFTVIEKPEKVNLTILTIAELGFSQAPRTDAWLTKQFLADWSAKNLDGQIIELCQPEDGLQLRIQYEDQLNGETLWMAMEPITGSDRFPFVLDVGRHSHGERWLDSDYAGPGDVWGLDDRLVFRLRAVSPQP